jgi:hypothetical protein
MKRGLRHLRAAVALVTVAACGAGVRGDDVAVEEQPDAQPGRLVFHGSMPEYDLGHAFDSQAFGGPMGTAVMINGVAAGAANQATAADEIAQRLEPLRRRAEAKIDTVDRIVGLSDKQRKKLEIAAQSDLRRLSDAVAEARAKYAGRTLKIDPRNGGFDEAGQKAMQQVQEDAQRCRQFVEAAGGSESLLAKVLVGTLDEPQAAKYAAVMQGRAACRWRAVVAAGLAQFDDQMGFTQKQYDAIAMLLVADVPALEEDQAANPLPAGTQVAQRLQALGDEKLGAILDPRQRSTIASLGGPAGGAWGAMPFAAPVPLPMPAMPMVPR